MYLECKTFSLTTPFIHFLEVTFVKSLRSTYIAHHLHLILYYLIFHATPSFLYHIYPLL